MQSQCGKSVSGEEELFSFIAEGSEDIFTKEN